MGLDWSRYMDLSLSGHSARPGNDDPTSGCGSDRGAGFLSGSASRLFSPVVSATAQRRDDRGSVATHRAFLAALGRVHKEATRGNR